MTGHFFCFDGMDGSGKTSQLRLFSQWLDQLGVRHITCRDPGSTPLGEAVRQILLDRIDVPLDMTAEMLLYQAARAQLVDQLIRPALDEGTTVVVDRFLLANVVYQGQAGGLNPADIWTVGRIATRGLTPRLTLIFDLDVATARGRLGGREDRLESRTMEYWERVRRGYLEEARGRADMVVIDAARSMEAIQAEVRSLVHPILDGGSAG